MFRRKSYFCLALSDKAADLSLALRRFLRESEGLSELPLFELMSLLLGETSTLDRLSQLL